MAGRAQRAFTLVIAIVFLVTSIAGSGLIIYQIITDDNQQAVTDTNIQETQATPKEGALKGTNLANYTPVDSVTELKVEDITVGTGKEVKASDTVTAHYTGAVASTGVIFESSLDAGQPATFPLSGVIVGWQEGVPGMKEGGKRRLIIPAEKAYGAQSPSPDIPANSALVFDIELVAVTPAQN
jgi:peptidylprolyl isomerase